MRRRRVSSVPGSQRGVAIVAALLVVIAAAAMATALIERQGVLAAELTMQRDRAQAAWALRGALDWSRVVLRMDAERSATTRLDGLWSHPVIDLPVGPAEDPGRILLSGQIEDEQGKFNLTSLSHKGRIDPQALHGLEQLLQWLRLEPALAATVAQRVAQSQAAEDRPPLALALRAVEDLAALEGFTPEHVRVLQPYLTVLPDASQINVNTSSPEVLAMAIEGVDLAAARALLRERDRGLWFTNRGDFINRLRRSGADGGQRVVVRSQWFRVAGEARVGATIVALRALLHRDEQGQSSVRWIAYP